MRVVVSGFLSFVLHDCFLFVSLFLSLFWGAGRFLFVGRGDFLFVGRGGFCSCVGFRFLLLLFCCYCCVFGGEGGGGGLVVEINYFYAFC